MRALGVDGAAELAAPDDQRVVQQAALLQVHDQGRRGLVDRPSSRSGGAGRCWRGGPSRPASAARTARRARSAARVSRQLRAKVPGVRTCGPYMSRM